MEGNAFVVFQGVGRAFDHPQVGVKAAGGAQPTGVGEHLAAEHVIAGYAGQVQGQAHARGGGVQAGLVALQAADAGAGAGRGQFDLLAHGYGAVNQRAGDYGAETAYGKTTVHGKAGPAQVAARFGVVQDFVDGGFEFVHAVAGVGRHRGHLAAGKGGILQHVLNFRLDQLHQFVVNQVGFRDDYQAPADAEQVQYRQVFPRLGHHALVGGDNQQGQVDCADAGQHILDEPFVARDVNDADFAPAGQGHPGKAEVNGHLPLFFFGQAVGVDVGEGLDQG